MAMLAGCQAPRPTASQGPSPTAPPGPVVVCEHMDSDSCGRVVSLALAALEPSQRPQKVVADLACVPGDQCRDPGIVLVAVAFLNGGSGQTSSAVMQVSGPNGTAEVSFVHTPLPQAFLELLAREGIEPGVFRDST